ncbi:vanadium-dependent haloperoxidase [Tunturibacter empetritectus]|uniref:Phosphoesterase n=1 Tax=Tunturiibacter empetritectus TaxID=3069691 RepID=A0A7W8IHW9_9BACT|nr:vanadium-dependent haloperoxidase [Edaphobacter lichenicola]MBB5316611.1 hypothetical protein [Edaphobacter lichenicola]
MSDLKSIESSPDNLLAPTPLPHLKQSNRRMFLGKMSASLVGALAVPSAAAAQTASDSSKLSPNNQASAASYGIPDNPRVQASFAIRLNAAIAQALVPLPSHQTNGDQQRYPDGSATYTKVVLQDSIGLVNPAAYRTFTTALASGKPSDFENIIIGGTRTLNGPQGGLAFTLEGTDSHQFGSSPSPHNQETEVVVPAPPAFSSPAWGTELTELYWCSLLRDTAFTDYQTSPVAAAACAELTSMPSYAGPRTHSGHVTPNLLFRGYYPGETLGPYISQLIITPSFFGALPLTNQYITYQAGLNYMLDPDSFLQVQNGINTGLTNQPDPNVRFLQNGRGLAAWTHVDVLFQAYFIAFLVMNTLSAPLNPGNPYATSRTQNGFDTLGGPDISATIGEVAARVLDTVWYQKWFVHLRPRPESSGGIAYLTKTNQLGSLQAKLNNNFLNSQALKASYDANNSWFLSQAFPEGSPAHPAYPTGHGTVAGACITILKFFYDGNFVIPNPQVPAPDGLSLNPYTGPDAGSLTINGELNKLAHNITFGHGIHGGIHWRSDSDDSILLGEAFALSFLQDKIRVYNEKLTVHLTKLDGTIATISNQ